ncbi:MAG: glycoside hydrolase family 3 protein, partial [Selenomonadaceae bacterium]|nr:glycoside hydrolase family 3 protein [Selenomonadaceae bacterium]
EDVAPFKKVIAENDNSKFMVMMGHLKYTALDNENPASISHAIITGLLREKLNFSGVIITDDLEMGATKDYHENIGVKAIKAGADIALVCHEYPRQEEVYLGILEAVKRGEIPESRINESVRRILKMKLQLNS